MTTEKTLCDHCGQESGELEDGAVDTAVGERVGKKCQALYEREAENVCEFGSPFGGEAR